MRRVYFALSLGMIALGTLHIAASAMLKERETWIKTIVAVDVDGRIVPPCGACRQFLLQLDRRNANACK